MLKAMLLKAMLLLMLMETPQRVMMPLLMLMEMPLKVMMPLLMLMEMLLKAMLPLLMLMEMPLKAMLPLLMLVAMPHPPHPHAQPIKAHGRLSLPVISTAWKLEPHIPSSQRTSALALSPWRTSQAQRDVPLPSGQT